MNKTKIVPLSAFKDNYIWALRSGTHAAVVDPRGAQPVLAYLAAEGLKLAAILATHHDPDHVGDIAEILRSHPCPVYGPRTEQNSTLTHPVSDGDIVRIPDLGAEFSVLDIPGHTRAHIAYYGLESVFCGGTHFAFERGRGAEGTAVQMFVSLAKLLALPDDSRVYGGHECTLPNVPFTERKKRGLPTLSSTQADQKATDSFLRRFERSVFEVANKCLGSPIGDPVNVFSAIRRWKNEF